MVESDGTRLGKSVDEDGLKDSDGLTDGSNEGSELGFAVGIDDGLELGRSVGDVDGTVDGKTLGDDDGTVSDGRNDGSPDGPGVDGSADGTSVGANVGNSPVHSQNSKMNCVISLQSFGSIFPSSPDCSMSAHETGTPLVSPGNTIYVSGFSNSASAVKQT